MQVSYSTDVAGLKCHEDTIPLRGRQDSAGYWGALENDANTAIDLNIGSLQIRKNSEGRGSGKVSFNEGVEVQTSPADASPSKQPGLVKKNSDYWNSANWDLDNHLAHKPQENHTPTTDASSNLSRKGSNAYWDADQWDPDQRVYVGAEAGQTTHLTAVISQGEDKLLRAWAGGLTSTIYGSNNPEATLDLAVASATAGQSEPPSLKDLYDVADSVGSGSFGVVCLARHYESDKPCVVKSVKKAQCGVYKSQVESGLYESLLTMSKDMPHKNIVQYLDALESNDHYYVIMENLSGPELLEKIEREFPVTEKHCQDVMREVVSALAHIHNVAKICHRDIKHLGFTIAGAPHSQLLIAGGIAIEAVQDLGQFTY